MNKCILCDSTQAHIIGKKFNYDILICKNCTLTKLDPSPSELELNEFYKNEYREKYSAQKYVDLAVIENEQRRADQIVDFFVNEKNTFKNHLDIGCSTGILINVLSKKLNIEKSWGIELNNIYAEYAKQYTSAKIVTDSLENTEFKIKFDHIGTCIRTYVKS